MGVDPLDNLDTVILRELLWFPDDPIHAARGVRRPWDIARGLGMHGTTVKRRLADMREKGLLVGVPLQPAAALVGRRNCEDVFTYKDAAHKARALDILLADPNVWACYSLVGNDIVVVSATPEDQDDRALVARLARDSGAVGVRFHHRNEWAVPVERVSALDLRILAAFAEDAHRPVSSAAAEVGIAPKTVTGRMRALQASRAFVIHPYVDHRFMEGGMSVYLDLTLALGAQSTAHVEIANRFPSALCRSRGQMENGHVVVQASSATDVEDLLLRAETIPGVTHVRSAILHQSRQEPARWKDALLARAEELARAKGIWAPTWRAKPAAPSSSR